MTSMTTAIIAKFSESVDINKEYGLSEILAILSADYKAVKAILQPGKAVKKTKKAKKSGDDDEVSSEDDKKVKKPRAKRERDADGNIIKKRPPSAYNIFVAEKIAEFKAENPERDSKENFKLAIAAWNDKKASGTTIVVADPVVVYSDGPNEDE